MDETKRYIRFDVARRIEHLVLIISFTTLGITGLVQKYAAFSVSDFIIRLLGGIETTRIIHHIAAAVFLVEAVYHLIILGYKLYVARVEATMLPGGKDIRDGIQMMGYNLGLTKNHPRMGRYNFAEKVEYLAMMWGLVLMGLTGLILWNPIASTIVLPGEFVPAAKSAHGFEAVLAVAAIIIWHFYNVHLKHWNWSMIKGSLSKKEMEEEHALELEKIEAHAEAAPVSQQDRARRFRIFMPVAAIVGIVLVYAIVRFLTFETTAVTTLPSALGGQPAYQRQTPTPLPTSAPTATKPPTPTVAPNQLPTTAPAAGGGATWNSSIGKIFQDSCGSCHGSAAMGGLNVTTYADLMKGGKSGPAIKPGDPNNSLVIQKMIAGHAKVFSDADLKTVSDWINSGALEK